MTTRQASQNALCDLKVRAILHRFRAPRSGDWGFSGGGTDYLLFRPSESIGKRFAGFYDPNLVIGKGDVSIGQLDLRHMTADALRLGGRTDLGVGLSLGFGGICLGCPRRVAG